MSKRLASLIGVVVLLSGLVVTTTAGPASAAPPSNDRMASPTVIDGIPATIDQSTVGAGVEPGEPLSCRNIGATVWYRFTTQSRGIIEVDVLTGQNGGPEFKPVLALYTGPDRDHLSRLGCTTSDGNATNLGGGNLPAGTYWVQAGGQHGATGDLRVVVGTTSTDGGGSRSGAVMDSTSCLQNVLNRNDDSSTGQVQLPFTLDFYGRSFSSLYVNNNGNVTFDSALSTYTPFGLSGTSRSIVAPFFADVDTRNAYSDTVKYGYGETLYEGRPAFCANWVDVGYYSARYDKTNSFQLLLVDRSDTGPGAFDIVFNYDRVQWETGEASGGTNGLGGSSARAGFSNGSGSTATSYELPGSAVNGAFLDSNSATGLANNKQSSDQVGRYVYAVRNGNPSCAGDADCDGLSDSVERYAGTSTVQADTDGDGLRDAWEVDPQLEGAGIRLPNGRTVSRDDAFGPFGSGVCEEVDRDLRPIGGYTCLNRPPDPRQKDTYLEIDWQDCKLGSCPEVARQQDDELHHAPNVKGLHGAVDMYARAPVSNPNGRSGVRLHVLVDERTPHTPNCLQSSSRSNLDRDGFGTATQRGYASDDVLKARNLVVRYMWSGHSSTHSDSGPCPNPGRVAFFKQGLGAENLASYDWSPFGSSMVGGSYMVASLGIAWNCPSAIGRAKAVRTFSTFLGPCFRETEANLINPNPTNIVDPGIYPARIDTPAESDKRITHPIHRMMGQREPEAGHQLWSRTLAHLMGHSLGLASDADVRNKPAPAGRKQSSHTSPLAPLAADSYATWSGLRYAPLGEGGSSRAIESLPNYDELGRTSLELSDPDDDGVMEHFDNCPGVWNPDQSNDDNGRFHLGHNTAELGDACDPDFDGDGLRNPTPGEGEAWVPSGGSLRTSAAETAAGEDGMDPMPFDTNNDGEDNAVDPDDDGDGVADGDDICRLDANPGQQDVDGDGAGNACDTDADGDGDGNALEVLLGSDPLHPGSRPEYVETGACGNGADDDRDGTIDLADSGCTDTDTDGVSDSDDLCDTVADAANRDDDGDGLGNACDQAVRIEGLETVTVNAASPGTRVVFSAREAGPWSLRADAGDCASGVELANGSYDPGPDPTRPRTDLVAVEAAQLDEGVTRLRVCVTGAGGTDSDVALVVRDTVAPQVSAPVLAPADDTGSSAADGVTTARALSFTGTAEAGSTVVLRRGELFVGDVVVGDDGTWAIADGGPVEEGTHTYTATAADDAENRAVATSQVSVDLTAPAVTITDGPAEGGSTAGTASFSFTTSEPASVECRLDGGQWQACTSPHELSGLRFGEHLLELRATDAAGNVTASPTARRWSVRYTFTGFFDPVENAPTVNVVKAGSSVPVKFSLDGFHGLDVLAEGSPTSVAVACDSGAPVSETATTVAPGSSSVQYDATTDQYTYVWKTDQAWAGECREFRLELADRSVHTFLVKLR